MSTVWYPPPDFGTTNSPCSAPPGPPHANRGPAPKCPYGLAGAAFPDRVGDGDGLPDGSAAAYATPTPTAASAVTDAMSTTGLPHRCRRGSPPSASTSSPGSGIIADSSLMDMRRVSDPTLRGA